ncbi:protein-disulfide reductase DsbD domain-containing protein [Niabella ginsengisoli]|uniref:Protein-disulfide reductase DsbD N-terminal domain-containing protein n=1 Tax=Niabella ginsengisoli TaxID=522298 RepID=A0ABS9SDW8_9BACT|nr:protein-disulfide reductase DsbD domain-containing protein [Niabella ginsengisoli]MCH5596549.1 protein-disulfide reductase DsbD N-terminal domain-containing protein [Niabella ginsengisoli]
MKKLLLALVCILTVALAQAQLNPVSWKFTSKKVSEKVYEIHMTAVISTGWHLYSQNQPEDAIAIPTKFSFTNNPLVKLDGKISEMGKMEKFHDASVDVSANQYSKTVTFVQKVTLKAAAKTNISGSVTYQTCDDKQCLPPKKVPFKVNLG